MSKAVCGWILALSLLLPNSLQSLAQEVRVTPPAGEVGGVGGAAAAGTLSNSIAPNLTPTLQAPTSAPLPSPDQTPFNPTTNPGVEAASPTPNETRPPLLWAKSSTEKDDGECDIADAVRPGCSGPECHLSCSPDACPGHETTKCEFALDCAAEIAADLASGDHQCDEQYLEHTTVEVEGNSTPITIVRIPVGEECKPPPCMK